MTQCPDGCKLLDGVAGGVQIRIERTFGLEDVPQALAHLGEGRALGKVVIEP